MSQQNIELVKKLFTELYSKNNLSIIDQMFSPNVKLNDPAVPHFQGGTAALRELENNYKNAFPNRNCKIDEIFAVEDRVVVRWTCQGTQKGELHDIAPTGKNIKVMGISIYHISNGKITEISQSWDRLSLLEQLGVIEPSLALHR